MQFIFKVTEVTFFYLKRTIKKLNFVQKGCFAFNINFVIINPFNRSIIKLTKGDFNGKKTR
ncbi:hypothetical protein D9R21_00610 [Spiroplasma endosymbiont of Megaselia nigra]|nr:hypothetical protein D9R21_00610 [Spiroplasma endosymbiont of Megaselia nigra]